MIVILFVVLGVVLSGCATAIHGKQQIVQIVSEPSGADVRVDGKTIGQTPVNVTLPRKQDHVVTIEKQGYHGEDAKITRSVSPVVLLYLLPGGAISFSADALHGSHFRFPDRVTVNLQPLFSPRAVLANQLNIMKSVARTLWWKKYTFSTINQL